MTERIFKKDEVIFRQGELGKTFYRVLEGCVGIIANYEKPEEMELTELSEGQIFGEMALIDFYPRSATAISKSEGTKVQEVEIAEATEFLKENPDRVLVLMRTLSDRLRAVTDDYDDVKAVIRELEEAKNEDEKEKRESKLRAKIRKYKAVWAERRSTSDEVTAEYLNDVKEAGNTEEFSDKVQKYSTGMIICREGKTVHCMYEIHYGRVGVYKGYGTDHEVLLTELYPGTFFGEAGMVSDEPRSATVVALEDSTVETIYKEDLDKLLVENPAKVLMILQHLTFRLRRISNDYLDACGELSRLISE